jgi:arginine exporter protein ArgO
MLGSLLAHLARRLFFVVLGLLIAILVQRFAPKTFWSFVSLILGILMGIFFHYLIYRFSLPTKPFVYVAF